MLEAGQERHEGKVTAAVEHVTARAPSATYLGLAGVAMGGALALFLSGRREEAIFVGLWPLAALSIGNYNKIVKLLGSERGNGRAWTAHSP
ncbi:MAG TPA: hypothetical protein VFG83_13660 [Kofleriaceae bacterium]|nr:hypothetical protein [Kofleriaceae bacterium]